MTAIKSTDRSEGRIINQDISGAVGDGVAALVVDDSYIMLKLAAPPEVILNE